MGSEVGLGFLDLCRDADPEDQPHHCLRRPLPGSEIGCRFGEITRRRFEELETENGETEKLQ